MPQISIGQTRHIDHYTKLLGGELIFVEYELRKVMERGREMEIKCYAILVFVKKRFDFCWFWSFT